MNKEYRKHEKLVRSCHKTDRTYIKIRGVWHYLYEVVVKEICTVTCLLAKRRERMNTQSFLINALANHGKSKSTNIDKIAANSDAILLDNKHILKTRSRIRLNKCK